MKNYSIPKLEVIELDITDIILESSTGLNTSDEAFGFDITERV